MVKSYQQTCQKAEQVKGELGELGGELQDVANTAKNTGAEIGNIIPKNASERAATLIKSLNEITEIIKSTWYKCCRYFR